jgi:starch phosphorylase
MKFMMNGALTLGTLDGANVEISERVGADNCYIFGLREEEVMAKRNSGYNPWDVYNSDADVKVIIDSLINGFWSNGDNDKFRAIFDEIMYRGDEYLILEDFRAYLETSKKIDQFYYSNRSGWARACLYNIAMSGFFSTDRTINEYNRDIWHLEVL